MWRPADVGANHDAYFSALNRLLHEDGPGHPVMLIDRARMDRNVDRLRASVGPDKTYRIVVKSLPSVPLLRHVMARANTNALMVFHRPFLNEIATAFPTADVLVGKPMPVRAAEMFYKQLGDTPFDASRQLQWLVDSAERLAQYQALARRLGVKMRVNLEIDVGLHRGGFWEPEAIDPVLATILADAARLEFAGFMGYEPHLTGAESVSDAAVVDVLRRYAAFVERAHSIDAAIDSSKLTLNGAGSHTLALYETDRTMNDLSAGSGVVKPTDFDTAHLATHEPALFIATPVLKRYDELKAPGDPWIANVLPLWNPNLARLHFIYGGYWKARYESPRGIAEPLYHSTNQEPLSTSASVDLAVDDYVFLRPTQSEHVMLQFGDLLVVDQNVIVDRWPVFQQTG
ncbi:MAG: DSD1 family PLP-dependent enzyme [Gammaproteobacteria bacterium]|nr:DSD1 family PLP-dependent enzyme [Gammaproteobacteria bacterium]